MVVICPFLPQPPRARFHLSWYLGRCCVSVERLPLPDIPRFPAPAALFLNWPRLGGFLPQNSPVRVSPAALFERWIICYRCFARPPSALETAAAAPGEPADRRPPEPAGQAVLRSQRHRRNDPREWSHRHTFSTARQRLSWICWPSGASVPMEDPATDRRCGASATSTN